MLTTDEKDKVKASDEIDNVRAMIYGRICYPNEDTFSTQVEMQRAFKIRDKIITFLVKNKVNFGSEEWQKGGIKNDSQSV